MRTLITLLNTSGRDLWNAVTFSPITVVLQARTSAIVSLPTPAGHGALLLSVSASPLLSPACSFCSAMRRVVHSQLACAKRTAGGSSVLACTALSHGPLPQPCACCSPLCNCSKEQHGSAPDAKAEAAFVRLVSLQYSVSRQRHTLFRRCCASACRPVTHLSITPPLVVAVATVFQRLSATAAKAIIHFTMSDVVYLGVPRSIFAFSAMPRDVCCLACFCCPCGSRGASVEPVALPAELHGVYTEEEWNSWSGRLERAWFRRHTDLCGRGCLSPSQSHAVLFTALETPAAGRMHSAEPHSDLLLT